MSDRSKAINIINSLPDSQVHYAFNMLQSFCHALDESADEAFCEKLYTDYLNDPDPEKTNGMSIESFSEQLGISL